MKQSHIPNLSKVTTGLLEKQIDGVFCTDGMLATAARLNEVVYLYFYRNEFILADTNLNLKYRAHTIDTVTKAKIKVVHNSMQKRSGLANPSALVNRKACIWNKWLFVNSNLISKNDDKELFKQSAVVDVYDLESKGAYKFSFRLYNHNGKYMHSFMPNKEKLFVINGQILISYKPNPEYFMNEL